MLVNSGVVSQIFMFPNNQWLVQMYFLLKGRPFLGDMLVNSGGHSQIFISFHQKQIEKILFAVKSLNHPFIFKKNTIGQKTGCPFNPCKLHKNGPLNAWLYISRGRQNTISMDGGTRFHHLSPAKLSSLKRGHPKNSR